MLSIGVRNSYSCTAAAVGSSSLSRDDTVH